MFIPAGQEFFREFFPPRDGNESHDAQSTR